MSTFTVTITENTTEAVAQESRLASSPIYCQTFAALDTAKVIAYLNAPVKPKRIYRAKAKTERAP
jgi:hypothetical protein